MAHEDPERIIQRLTGLRAEHRELDAAIDRQERDHTLDQLQITRMKKRRLHLKDAITRLESDLIPDLDA